MVLIDEYDKPILGEIENIEQAVINRKRLKEIYGTLKDSTKHIQFIFITGISLFSKLNQFSGLNNLYDISLDPKYGAICGYTDNDLDTVFAPELTGLNRNDIRSNYNGYYWLGSDKVYNPHSILHLFHTRKFLAWWSMTSVPEYLYNILAKKNVTPIEISNRTASNTLMSSFELNTMSIDSLLFQSGYLTIAGYEIKGHKIEYRLKHPNFEVRQSLNEGFLTHIIHLGKIGENFEADGEELVQCLMKNKFIEFKNKLYKLLAKAPYPWYDSVKAFELQRYECWYASVVYWSFIARGI